MILTLHLVLLGALALTLGLRWWAIACERRRAAKWIAHARNYGLGPKQLQSLGFDRSAFDKGRFE